CAGEPTYFYGSGYVSNFDYW
nr:immunoglobulin heavy chain junction region [Macaca mulatta]